jgi:hypothetical protein
MIYHDRIHPTMTMNDLAKFPELATNKRSASVLIELALAYRGANQSFDSRSFGNPKRKRDAVPIPRLRFGLPSVIPTHFEELICTVMFRRWLALCLVFLLSASPAFGEVIAEGFDINPHGTPLMRGSLIFGNRARM